MNKIVQLIHDGELTLDDLAKLPELVARARLIVEALEATTKTICIHRGQYATAIGTWSSLPIGGETIQLVKSI